MGKGEAIAFSLYNLQARGTLFIAPQAKVYNGMVIGESARPGDLEVNPLKGKQLTNMRSAGADDAIKLVPPKVMTLEQALEWIEDDELVEVTPKNIRVRKKHLDPAKRRKLLRDKKNEKQK